MSFECDEGNWWVPTAQKIIICGIFAGSQIWPPGMVEAFKNGTLHFKFCRISASILNWSTEKKRIPPWIPMDPHESPWLRVFQKRPKEMDLGLEWLARVEIQNVWVDQNPPCGVHSYWRSRKHVLEVTSCFRSLPQKIWRYATSGPPRFPKGVEWVEVTYQKQVGHPTQILVPGDSATFTWHGPKVALLWSWPSARNSSTQGSEGDCDEVKKWHF